MTLHSRRNSVRLDMRRHIGAHDREQRADQYWKFRLQSDLRNAGCRVL